MEDIMAEYITKGRNITLTADPASCQYKITVFGAEWTMSDRPYVVFSGGEKIEFPMPKEEGVLKTGTTDGVYAIYEGFGEHKITVRTSAEIEKLTDDVYFTVQVDGDGKCEIECVSYPAPFDFGEEFGDHPTLGENNLPHSYSVIPVRQGQIIPTGTKIGGWSAPLFSAVFYMPIFGQVRGGTGYLAIFDTPYDAKCSAHRMGEKIEPMWVPTLGHMSYRRKIIFRFMENCDYNDFALSYRQYVKDRGRLITLKEKIAKNPRVRELLGCPIIHEGIANHISPESDYYKPDRPEANDNYVTFAERAEQIKALRERGLKKAYTHFDGWGNHGYDNLHPSPFPPHEKAGGADGMRCLAETVQNCGYLFGIHDQYRDYYYDAPDFSFDNAVLNADGSHPYCSIWYGGPHTYLCSSAARDYVRRNYTAFDQLGIKIDGSYLDVFSLVDLDECFNPAHPATREDCAAYRRECLEYLTSKGIIPSSEEVTDCILPAQVLCHHAPFSLNGNTNEVDAIPIPLFNLVYHDCIVIPWDGQKGCGGGYLIPKELNGWLYAYMCGNPVYIPITADENRIAEVEEVCQNAERLACLPMIRHEFVTPDGRVQRTTFDDGTPDGITVEADFDTDQVTVK